MPDYNAHRFFNYAALFAAVVLLYIWNISFVDISIGQFLILCVGYYVGTEFITPDLDIKSTAIKRWGRLKVLWLPYRLLFKHGKSSHNIIYGAVVRILYISLIILAVYYFLFKSLPAGTMVSSVYVFIFLIGIIIANALHVIIDILF